ncbi:Secreted subtilisin-like serine protease sub5 [Orbilia oligospora]|uniref:Secreted subtilisin-like serine protease sub5 n=1 Tax=Orbilia oligospora TaxID=2813651 RepID=A0A7C8UV54_ORBOL|nr:Secreted subtilisin-like serine protease sub5 [Orbilia oligospora]KAF3228209.1 Secreted subtilisin-like serine protease sub5 [Orbilia oligospora]
MGTLRAALTRASTLVVLGAYSFICGVISDELANRPLPDIQAKIGTVEHAQEHWIVYINPESIIKDKKVPWYKEYYKAVEKYLLPPSQKNFHIYVDSWARSGYINFIIFKCDPEFDFWETALKDIYEVYKTEITTQLSIYTSITEEFPNPAYLTPWLTDPTSGSSAMPASQDRTSKRSSLLIGRSKTKQPSLNETRSNSQQHSALTLGIGNGNIVRRANKAKLKRARLDSVELSHERSPELQIIAQPPSMVKAPGELPRFGDFSFYSTQGKGQIIYVVDTGLDINHPELKNANIQDWIFPDFFPGDEKKDQRLYHGTGIAGQLVGKTIGIVPQVEIVVVDIFDGRNLSTRAIFIQIFVAIRHHITTKNYGKNCIINMCTSWDNTDIYAQRFFEAFLHWAKSNKVIVVVPSGNFPPNVPINSYPASLFHDDAKKEMFWKQLVVVGGVDMTGQQENIFQTAPYVKVSAPATRVWVAGLLEEPGFGPGQPSYPSTIEGLRLEGGTSVAAPLVSGMIAMWLGAEIFTTNNVVEEMYKLAYNRTENGPNILYNGISPAQWPSQDSDDSDDI